MRPGKLVTTTHIREMAPGVNFDWKAEKGRQFVFIFLGDEPKDGSDPLDPVERLQSMGWTPPEDLLLAQKEATE